MSKHTPGPWHWKEDGWTAADAGGSLYFSDGEGNQLIDKYMGLQLMAGEKEIIPIRIDHWQVIYDGDPISSADRRLIAAAPELLAALRDLREHFLWRYMRTKKEGVDYDVPAQVLAADAAIAKAEGE